MSTPLLTTKLHLPILRREIISRARLVERLNAGLRQPEGFVRKLTLVSAPAGFGKTTLVSEWFSGLNPALLPPGTVLGVRTAWLSLDESDNALARFLAYFIAALQLIHPEFGGQTESILQLPQPQPPAVVLTSLINELSSLPTPFILALDDYHAIHTPDIHQQLAFILDHQPANMHLVILTREDPLLPVARLRARGQLLEIRQNELRFTQEEIAEFFQRGMGLSLGKSDIDALEHHTEGWIAGLQLAALSMQGHADPQSFIQSFTGSSRYILDYLIEEVFERQTPDVKDFLLKTSILEQFSAPLCDAVAEQTGSQKILEVLEQANLFIVPLDQSRTWYRYNHLFAELLRHHLRTANLSQAALHQRASQWYESQGLHREAVDHSLAAQDWSNAARLIGITSETMLKYGEYGRLLNWCGRFPQPVVYSSGDLCLVHAWAALLASQFDIAAPLLEHAEQLAEPESHFLGQVASAQAFLGRAKRGNARTINKSEQALALLPDTETAMRGIIAMNLGLAYWHEGHLAEVEPVLLQACDLCSKSGNAIALLTSQIFLARMPAAQGKLHQAAAMAEELIHAGGQIPHLCQASYDLATIHNEWNSLPKAWEYFEQGFTLSERSGNVELQQAGFLLRAILAHAQGDDAVAITSLSKADAMARDFPAVIRSRTAAFGVQLALARNDPRMLAHWEPQVHAEVDAHSFYRFMGLTRPRLLIAQGNKDKAAEVLNAIYETASQSGWGYGMIVVRILQSLAAKNTDEAMQFFPDALRMGKPEGFIRSFVDAGLDLIPVLQEAVRRGIEPEYADRILSALGKGQRGETEARAGLIEPLSEREIEVMRLVMAGLSNREIAEKLVISPGTAKTHIHNICGKLGAKNRTEAAMQAKALNLA